MKIPRLWPRRLYRLDVTLRSGAVVSGFVTEYTVRHDGSGVTAINWSQSQRCLRKGPTLIHFSLEDVVAITAQRF